MPRPCPFCSLDPDLWIHSGEHVVGIWDRYPVTPGHALLLPRRHVESWFEASAEEQAELYAAVNVLRERIEREHGPVAGYNLGINVGAVAGQTVPHLHLHVIPRRAGDVADPRGGVRHVIPEKGNYLRDAAEPSVVREAALAYGDLVVPERPAVVGGPEDPLLPHLIEHLDRAREADIVVAFVLRSGVAQLAEALRAFLDRGGRLRILTGDYLDATDPDALQRLLDLALYSRVELDDGGAGARVELRVFESRKAASFHPKAYIFRFAKLAGRAARDGVAYVGSSNLSKTGLSEGHEWNYSLLFGQDRVGFRRIERAFEKLFEHRATQALTQQWIEEYRARRRALALAPSRADAAPPAEAPEERAEPHEIQHEALEALALSRAEGNAAGLVVMATGLGKTWIAGFDMRAFGAKRTLFVAHREEILRQALDTFRRILPNATLGLFTGQEKNSDADVLFASVQSLSRAANLRGFAPDAFDYIVVDEFHHASAATYRRLLDHFAPRFLLGLTATPERTDGGSLLALCGENLAYRCSLFDALRRGAERLVPFHYYGVPDEVDYATIPWRNHRFDPAELAARVETRSRADNALEQWRKRGGKRTLGFCCSKTHADFMAAHFVANGVRAVAVHSGESSAPRATSLAELRKGKLECIFSVDMFNEGVDLPEVDTVLMLRPTESSIVFLQQLGRGLRACEGKTRLNVVDYIGNHRSFKVKPQALLGLAAGDAPLRAALRAIAKGDFAAVDLPPGCAVTYELEARQLLEAHLRAPRAQDALAEWYADFEARTGARPLAVEAFHEGQNPRSARASHGTWLGFVAAQGGITEAQEALRRGEALAAKFLERLEKTSMSRSFKMLVLLAMLRADALPGAMELDALCAGVRELARRSARIRADFEIDIGDAVALRAYLRKNPVAAWAGTKKRAAPFFRFDDGVFASRFEVPPEARSEFQDLVRELAEWRLADYLARSEASFDETDAELELRCKVLLNSRASPILKLPSRAHAPEIPHGELRVSIDGRGYIARFAKEFVNVVTPEGETENVLAELMTGFFGEDAGLAGRMDFVAFRFERGAWTMRAMAPGQVSRVGVGRPAPTVGALQQVRAADGELLDAHFRVARRAEEVALLYESRGGKKGSKSQRNADYAPGLQRVFERLRELGLAIPAIRLDTSSKGVQAMSLEERRLDLGERYAYPLRLDEVEDLDDLRRAVMRAQGKNPTRKIRIELERDHVELDALFAHA